MKIAVTYDNGNIFQHFGHTEFFKVYDIENGEIICTEIVSSMGSGHGQLAGMLSMMNVDAVICGGIGGGAKAALADEGIMLYGGCSGNADNAVNALLKGDLIFKPDIECSHHEHSRKNHSCTEHNCDSDSCHS